MAIPTLLSQQGPGPAAQQATSGVNVNEGAIGNYEGLSKFGQGVQQAGTTVGDALARKAHFAAELEKRKDQTNGNGLKAATIDAAQLTQEHMTEVDRSGKKIDNYTDYMGKAYTSFLDQTSKTYNVDPALIADAKYHDLKSVEYGIRDQGLKRDDFALESLRVASATTITKSQLGSLFSTSGTPSGSFEKTLSSIESMHTSVSGLAGVQSQNKAPILSSIKDNANLLFSQFAPNLTDEQRSTAHKRLVDIGFSANEAHSVLKAPTLTEDSKRVIKSTSGKLASAGKADEANELILRAGLPNNEVVQLTNSNNITADVFNTKKKIFTTEFTVAQRKALREEMANDASGVAVIQRRFKGLESTFSNDEWKSMQADLGSTLDVSLTQLDKNPGQFIDDQSGMKDVITEVTYAMQQAVDPNIPPDAKTQSQLEVASALRKYSVAYDAQAKRLDITHTPGLPRMPQAVSSALADSLTGNPETAKSTAYYLRSLVVSGDEGGRDLAQGVVSNLSRRGDEKSKRVGAAMSLAISAGSANSVEVVAFISTVSAHAFDFDKQQRVEAGLAKTQIFVGGTDKTMDAGAYLNDLMATVGTTANVDTPDMLVTQRISSADKGQNLNNLAAAFSGTNNTDIKASQDMLRGTVLNMAADAQGNVTKESLDRAVSSLTAMATTAGLVSVKNPHTKLYNLAQVSVKKSKTISILSPAQAGQFESITNVAASAQAVANFFPSFAKSQSSARYNTGASGLTSAVLDLSKATTHPMDMVASFYEKGVNAYSRWNMSLLGRDVGTTDISEDYLFPKAMAKFGFKTEGHRDPGKKDGTILSPLEFSNRVYQVPQPDRSIDVMWKEGGVSTLAGRMSKGTDRNFGKVYTIPANQVRAAYDYARLQGTSAAADATYEAGQSGKYADKGNDPYGKLVSDTAGAVWANSKWKAIGKVMDKYMPVQPISPRMMEVSPVAQFSSALKGPIGSTEDLIGSSLSIEEPGLLVLADRILAAQASGK